MSAEIPAHVVCATCGHVLEVVAARLRRRPSGRTSRSRWHRCRAPRTAGRAPRSTGGGRGRRGGSRRRPRSARPARARKAANRLPSAAVSVDERRRRGRRRRSARWAGGCRDRSTCGSSLRLTLVATQTIVSGGRGREARTVECPGDAQPPRRPEVRRLVGRRRRPHQARRPADRARARGRPRPRRRRLGDGRHHRRAARPGRGDHRRARTRASSTSCSRPASTRARRSSRWRSTRSASPAISLTGPQAGITTDGTLRPGPHRRHRAAPGPRRARRPARSSSSPGFQGQSATPAEDQEITTLGRGGSDTTAVALAAAPRRRPLPDLHRRPRHLHRRPAARARRPASCRSSATRRCSSSPTRAPRSCRSGPSSSAGSTTSSSRSSARSRTRPGTLIKEDPLVEQRNKVRGLAHDRNVAKVTVVAVPDRPGVARSIFDPLAEAGVNVDMIVQNVGHGGATDLSFTVPAGRAGGKAKKTLEPVVRELGARELTTDASVAKVSHRRRRAAQRPGLRGADVRDAGRRRRQHRDDLDLGGPDHLHDRRGRARDRAARAARRLRARAPRADRRRRRPADGRSPPDRDAVPRPPGALRPWSARPTTSCAAGWPTARRRSASPSPTSRPPVAAARAGRGSRRPARALLLSLGFRPTWLAPDRVWRLAAIVSLAMAEAAEAVAGLPDGAIRLKWPNDLVVERTGRGVRKLGGVLGETDGPGHGRPARGRRHRAQRRLARRPTSRRSSPAR